MPRATRLRAGGGAGRRSAARSGARGRSSARPPPRSRRREPAPVRAERRVEGSRGQDRDLDLEASGHGRDRRVRPGSGGLPAPRAGCRPPARTASRGRRSGSPRPRASRRVSGHSCVRAPAFEGDVAVADPGKTEVESARPGLAHLSVFEVGRAEVDRHHASQRTCRCSGARNSQPLKTGGRSGSWRIVGSRSNSRCTAIRICTREKW